LTSSSGWIGQRGPIVVCSFLQTPAPGHRVAAGRHAMMADAMEKNIGVVAVLTDDLDASLDGPQHMEKEMRQQ